MLNELKRNLGKWLDKYTAEYDEREDARVMLEEYKDIVQGALDIKLTAGGKCPTGSEPVTFESVVRYASHTLYCCEKIVNDPDWSECADQAVRAFVRGLYDYLPEDGEDLMSLIRVGKFISNQSLNEQERVTLQLKLQEYKNPRLHYNKTWYMKREIAGLLDAKGKHVMVDKLDDRRLDLPLKIWEDKLDDFCLMYPAVYKYLTEEYVMEHVPRSMLKRGYYEFRTQRSK